MVSNTIQIRKGSRKKNRLRMSIDGVSKSGKTFTALRCAYALGSKVLVIDTQKGQSELYHGYQIDGKVWDFDVIDLENCDPTTFVAAIQMAGREGYDAVIIDSFSHEWYASLELVDAITANSKSKNAFTTGWKAVTPQHNEVIESIQRSPCHVIATMRAKVDYVIEKDERGVSTPRKVGLGTIQREGVEYEFDLTCRIDLDHTLYVSGRCPAVDGKHFPKPGPEFMQPVIDWLNDGGEIDATRFAVTEADLKSHQKRMQAEAKKEAASKPRTSLVDSAKAEAKAETKTESANVPFDTEKQCTHEQREAIHRLFVLLFGEDQAKPKLDAALQKRNVGSLMSLSQVAADEMIGVLETRLAEKRTKEEAERKAALGESREVPNATAADISGPCTKEQIERVKSALVFLKQTNSNIVAEYKAALSAAGLKETADLTQQECEQLLRALGVNEMQAFFGGLEVKQKPENP